MLHNLLLGQLRPLGDGDGGRTQRWHRQSLPLKVTHSPAGKACLRDAGSWIYTAGPEKKAHLVHPPPPPFWNSCAPTCRRCTRSRRDGRSCPGLSPPHPPRTRCSCCRACHGASGSPAGRGSRRSAWRSRSEPGRSRTLHAHTQGRERFVRVWQTEQSDDLWLNWVSDSSMSCRSGIDLISLVSHFTSKYIFWLRLNQLFKK